MANGKERTYDEFVGRTYGLLTITEILPRRYRPTGGLEAVRVKAECLCGGVIESLLYKVINGECRSCGCAEGLKDSSGDFATQQRKHDAAIAVKLHAKYKCEHPIESCIRSDVARICCRECDKKQSCGKACANTPQKCGATSRWSCFTE